MHTLSALHKLLAKSVAIHAIRLNALMAAVHALTQGTKAQIASLGRHLAGNAYTKHKIKRMDRLISNPHLCKERHSIYIVFTQRLIAGLPKPIILIDWSPLCADQSWQVDGHCPPLSFLSHYQRLGVERLIYAKAQA